MADEDQADGKFMDDENEVGENSASKDGEPEVENPATLAAAAMVAHSDGEPIQLEKILSSAGLFSYSGLCAVSLKVMFETDFDKKFRMQFLQSVIERLKQSKQVSTSMFALMEGSELLEEADPFVKTLLEEEVIQGDPLLIPKDMLALALKEGYYDARMRVLIHHIAWLLKIKSEAVEKLEDAVVEELKAVHKMSEDEVKEKQKNATKRKIKRYALIGLAGVGGGALIGLTGGLAAPFLAAGAGVIIGGAGAAALGTTAGVAIIGSLFGVAGAGLTGYKMKKRVGAVEEFLFEPLSHGNQLHITIAVSGWITQKQPDYKHPWLTLNNGQEQFSLRWESQYLMQMGQAIDYLVSAAVSMAVQETLKTTILAGILTAIAWPSALVTVSGVIDNPWSVCTNRAAEAGRQLAEVLLSRQQGKRPVTLIGFSLGARLIFCCLTELAKRKGCEGIIEDVILLGAPVSGHPKHWEPLSRVVAGKIINVYSRSDWVLKFLYRTASVQFSIAGLAPVKWHNRRLMNFDLTDVVKNHMDYHKKMETILKIIGVKTRPQKIGKLSVGLVQSSSKSLSVKETEESSTSSDSSDSHSITQHSSPTSSNTSASGGEETGNPLQRDIDDTILPREASETNTSDIDGATIGSTEAEPKDVCRTDTGNGHECLSSRASENNSAPVENVEDTAHLLQKLHTSEITQQIATEGGSTLSRGDQNDEDVTHNCTNGSSSSEAIPRS
ncbi:transmembrane and coiled-coil domain-containing protein 4 isoform X2 [Lingula anatina]|uniref:Transmembrane and coiled-coil domain-containing protein 4 isoform X2 n=1 Tax=Lingula anatina TaxID=7574 RepID=A0A1S3HBK4_LINAN|nr:transmembrane and coiled-coil domain-containing protein 4 isoform X2 [Lingula anatina]|eukprot:XP_013383393.1 transmembrane and coiled-coil domain-containing protein 4 isoform X2 [Lingula anatina]